MSRRQLVHEKFGDIVVGWDHEYLTYFAYINEKGTQTPIVQVGLCANEIASAKELQDRLKDHILLPDSVLKALDEDKRFELQRERDQILDIKKTARFGRARGSMAELDARGYDEREAQGTYAAQFASQNLEKLLSPKRNHKGEEEYRWKENDRVAFIASEKGIKFYSASQTSIECGAELAAKNGWKGIQVTGDPEFRRAAWFEASMKGMIVQGYEPTERDKRLLSHLRNEKSVAQAQVVVAENNASQKAATPKNVANQDNTKVREQSVGTEFAV